MDRLRFGVSVPNFGGFADPRATATLGSTAERAGWDGVFVWDHLLGWDGNEVADPWTVLASVAVATERVRLGPVMTPLARRRPWVVARQVATLDRLSNGRLTLGVGLGSPRREDFELFGEPADERVRARILDEALDVLTGPLTGAPFSHDGDRFHVEEVTFLPTCAQEPRVPIWVGGAWPHRAPFRRAARFDGVVPISVSDGGGDDTPTVATFAEATAFVRGLRGGTPFDAVFLGGLPGDPARTRDRMAELSSAGATWWLVTPGYGDGPDAFAGAIRGGPPTA